MRGLAEAGVEDVAAATAEAHAEYLTDERRAYWRSYMAEHAVLKGQLHAVRGGGGEAGGGRA